MTSPTCIHHINFIVSDLKASVSNYERILDLGPFEFEDLPQRGVSTARILLGGTWLVLVCPNRADSVPGRYLEKHGEGFFLLSFGVNNLDAALKDYEQRGAITAPPQARQGLTDWRVADLDTEDALGVKFHLTETPAKPK